MNVDKKVTAEWGSKDRKIEARSRKANRRRQAIREAQDY